MLVFERGGEEEGAIALPEEGLAHLIGADHDGARRSNLGHARSQACTSRRGEMKKLVKFSLLLTASKTSSTRASQRKITVKIAECCRRRLLTLTLIRTSGAALMSGRRLVCGPRRTNEETTGSLLPHDLAEKLHCGGDATGHGSRIYDEETAGR